MASSILEDDNTSRSHQNNDHRHDDGDDDVHERRMHEDSSRRRQQQQPPPPSGNCIERAMYHLCSHWKILVLGQIMSLLLASGGAAQATLHVDCGLSAPAFTMAMAYLIQTSLQWCVLLLRRRKERQEQRQYVQDTHHVLILDGPRYNFCHVQLHRPVWQYLLMGFLDCQANALTMLAFRYTTLTSVTLLDALAIPSAMLLSKAFLNRQYTYLHIAGLLVCMVGIILNVLQDAEADIEGKQHSNSSSSSSSTSKTAEELAYPHKVWGDILAASGGILYGLNDVLAEATVRSQNSIAEYLAMVGLFGFLFSFFQAMTFEWDNVLEFFDRDVTDVSTCSLSKGWSLYIIFVIITVVSYIGGTRFLMLSEAAFFNLSLLTGDLWSVLFSIFAEHFIPRPLFFVALIFVLSGVILYEMAPHPVVDEHKTLTAAEQLAEIDNDFELHGMNDDDGEWADGDNHNNNNNNDFDYEEDDIELL